MTNTTNRTSFLKPPSTNFAEKASVQDTGAKPPVAGDYVVDETSPSAASAVELPKLVIPKNSFPNRPILNGPPALQEMLSEARNKLATSVQERLLSPAELTRMVLRAYPEAAYLVGSDVKNTPDLVTMSLAGLPEDIEERLKSNPEFAKMVARIAFTNAMLCGGMAEAMGGMPMEPALAAEFQGAFAKLKEPDASPMWDLKSFLNALVAGSLGKSDSLFSAVSNKYGGHTESPELRIALVLENSPERIPCVADTDKSVIETLRVTGRAEFNVSMLAQGGECVPATLKVLESLSTEQRTWFGVLALCRTGAAWGMEEGGIFPALQHSDSRRQLDAAKALATHNPVRGYFEFLAAQAKKYDLPLNRDGFALTRILLTHRDFSASDAQVIKEEWAKLPESVRLNVVRGLTESGLTNSELKEASEGLWNIDGFGSDRPAPLVQYSPALLFNCSYREWKGLRDDISAEGFTRGVTVFADLLDRCDAFIDSQKLNTPGVLRIDGQRLASTAWQSPQVTGAQFFDYACSGRGEAVDKIRLEAVAYVKPSDLERMRDMLGSSYDECRLLQTLGAKLNTGRTLRPSTFVGDRRETSLSPSRVEIRPSREATATDPHFIVDDETIAKAESIIERFEVEAEASFNAGRNLPAPLSEEIENSLAEFRQEVRRLMAPAEYPFRAFIGVLDRYAADPKMRSATDHYGLRRLAMFAAQGELESWHAFTFAKRSSAVGGMWNFLADQSNWLPERVAIQNSMTAHCFVNALTTSEAIQAASARSSEDELPPVRPVSTKKSQLAAGPYASGKTSTLYRQHGSALVESEVQVLGLVGPDFIKTHAKDRVDGGATPEILHNECSQLAYCLSNDMERTMRGVFLFDTSLASPHDLLSHLENSKDGEVIVTAVHVPLHVTLMRMLLRKVRGADPRVTFDGTCDGWKRTVDNRDAILEVVRSQEYRKRCSYEMTASDLMGRNYQRVMSIQDGVDMPIDPDRWAATLKPLTQEKRNEWRGTLLRDFVADKDSLAADDAQRLADALSQRFIAFGNLRKDEQELVAQRVPDGNMNRDAMWSFMDLPIGVALNVHARATMAWPDEIKPKVA